MAATAWRLHLAGCWTAAQRKGPEIPCAVESARSSVELASPRFARSRVPPAFTPLFKSSSGTLGIWDGQHEAHFARGGSIGTNVLCCCSSGGAPFLFRRGG